MKTHTPADGVPFWPTASYVIVVRDGRDAFMSAMNHIATMRPEVVARINEEAIADGGAPIAWSQDVHEAFPRWLASDGSVATYLASWWPRRTEPNVAFVHYNDLKADLDGEMRRMAEFLRIEVPSDQWPGVVERCTFEAMKARPDEIGPFEFAFIGGVDSFLYKGTNGRWREVLTDDELASYASSVSDHLSPDAARWLEEGAIASGFRP